MKSFVWDKDGIDIRSINHKTFKGTKKCRLWKMKMTCCHEEWKRHFFPHTYNSIFPKWSWSKYGHLKSISPSACYLIVIFYSLSLFFFFFLIFSRGHATLHLGLSVGRSVGPSHFWIPSDFRITAPAQPSATGLPCIRPCLLW